MTNPAARTRRARAIGALILTTLLAACGGGGGDNNTGGGGGSGDARISGTVKNVSTGQAIAGATVTAGSATATTDADGAFTITNAAAGDRVVVKATADRFAPNFETTSASAATPGTVQLLLVPEYQLNLDARTGGSVSDASTGARVTLPANGLVSAGGTPYAGTVTVRLGTIAPATNLNAMPGELLAASSSGTAAIESFGALSVVLQGTAGESLNLAGGQNSTVRIPVSSRTPTASLPATIPLYYFNESTGLWVEEGSATLAADKTYYEGTVSHFTVWNADRTLDTITYTGCVVNAQNQRASGVTVYSEGIDYSGSSRALTDANGVFTIPMKKSGSATILGVLGSSFTNTISALPPATASAISDLTTCLNLGSSSASLSIKLSWGERPSDVDSHLYFPNGSHVYYGSDGSLVADPFAALDVDDTTSFGPEVITVRKLMVGTYRYALNNFSKTTGPGMTDSPVRVELTHGGNTRTFTPTAGETASTYWWSVFDFTVDAQCNVSVAPVGTWSATAPTTSPTATPVYCTPP